MSDIETQTTLRDQLASAFTKSKKHRKQILASTKRFRPNAATSPPSGQMGASVTPATGKFVAQERQETQAPSANRSRYATAMSNGGTSPRHGSRIWLRNGTTPRTN